MPEPIGKLIPLFTALIIAAGLAVPMIYPILKKRTGLFLSLLPLLVFIAIILHLILNREGGALITGDLFEIMAGVDFSFRIDGLSIIFGLMISGIGFFVLLYSAYYMGKYERQGHFYMYLMVFMGAMTAMVFTDNLVALFIFWELTSITSFLLIGFDFHSAKSRQAALQSLLITAIGGLCLMFAVILIGNITGTYRISELLSSGVSLTTHSQYPLIFILILMAVLTKSAQFPFHFWLPGAMQAPTPVSSYLHSATMVNAGIFLLLRIHPFIGGSDIWKVSLMLAGGITMFLGAFFSMGQKDLKRILAFTTISALGTMVLLIGIDTVQAAKAALVFFIVHALYKGGLFMMAGIADKSTGTRDITILSNLGKSLPFTSIAAVLSLISMAGLPPMLGFIGKELIYEAKIQLPGFAWLVLPLGVGANIMMVAVSLTVFFEVFYPTASKQSVTIKHRESYYPWYFPAGAIVLAVAGLVLGMMPGRLDNLISDALLYVRSQEVSVKLSLWHGFNKVLLVSALTVLAGVIVFRFRRVVIPAISRLIGWFDKLFLPDLFMKVMKRYLEITKRNTNRIQHGYHRFYLLTFFLVTLGIVAIQLIISENVPLPASGFSEIRMHVVLLLLVSALAVVFAVFSTGRLTAIVAMGVVGYGIGLIYLFYGAVDLAITQFLAETVLMVLFVMVMYKLPRFAVLSTKTSRIRDAIISLAIGGMVTLVVLNARFINLFEPISSYYLENSLTEAHGRNIVNVILVDFRALDTLGEITVLTLAAVGVYALFNIRVRKQADKNSKG
jgi:multicomponent Na+:H+ antiporter subunit A